MLTTLLIDAHVHYHACFGVSRFLEAASANLEAARSETGRPGAMGVLMFTESSWHHHFKAFGEGLVAREAPGWSVSQTLESRSLLVCKDEATRLLLVAGRQIVTAERLEVLALATTEEYPDGLGLADAVKLAEASGAVTVLPWGFGKWNGRRGRLMRDLLASPWAGRIFLGDNGGRPSLAPRPALFREAARRGIPVLPGSDPLPLAAEVVKPASCGFVLEGQVDLETPAAGIVGLLAARPQPRPFGRHVGLATFVRRQAALRLRRGPAPVAKDA